MAVLKITETQAQELLRLRTNKPYNWKVSKKQIFSEIHSKNGIPRNTKIKFFIESPDHPLYRVIRNKHTNASLTDGQDEPVPVITKATSPAAKVAGKVKADIAAAAKKVPAKKAPAAVKVAKGGWSATKTPDHQIEVRGTVNGVRVRLGWAKTEADKAKKIAAAKKEAGV